jgi:hypothetical protein
MIYYFSGTGNSKWVAEEIARRTDDEAQSIAELVKDGPTVVCAGKDARIGVVFQQCLRERRLWSVFARVVTLAGRICVCGLHPAATSGQGPCEMK